MGQPHYASVEGISARLLPPTAAERPQSGAGANAPRLLRPPCSPLGPRIVGMRACLGPLSVQKVAFGALAAWIEQESRREPQTAPKEDPKRGRGARSAARRPNSHRRSPPLAGATPPAGRVRPFGLPCRPLPSAAG